MKSLFLLLLLGGAALGRGQSLPENLAPNQTRLTVAQNSPGTTAISSQAAAANQGDIQIRLKIPDVPPPKDSPSPSVPAPERKIFDPRLDPSRPKNCQLSVAKEQTLACGPVTVVLPPGTYQQKLIVEGPEGKRAIGETTLSPQQVGLGYIRYLSDVPLKIDGVERVGGLDVAVRPDDGLPVRVWYRKMDKPDDITKAFTFILPPVGLFAGLGAWSSGNVLLPDSPPEFTEARDYFLKPLKPEPTLDEIPQPAHVRPIQDPYAVDSNRIRSK